MTDFRLEEAYNYYASGDYSVAEACKKHCEDIGIAYEEKYRHRVNRHKLGLSSSAETKSYTDKTVEMPSAWDKSQNKFLDIDEYCDRYGLPKDQVRSSKLVAHTAGHMIYNIVFSETFNNEVFDKEFILGLIAENNEINPSISTIDIKKHDYFDRLIFTDVHVGMEPKGAKNTNPMYETSWTQEDIEETVTTMVEQTIAHKRGDLLVVSDLGDFLDGFGGFTTRGGHGLPQTMSDKEVFAFALKLKMSVLERLMPFYKEIWWNDLTNDNHGGVFSWMLSYAFKNLAETKYNGKAIIKVVDKFMHHYSIGCHTFIESHGKDSNEMKFGLKSSPDAKAIEKIDHYCKKHGLYNGNLIEFSMGDQHQSKVDETTSNDFEYVAYPALSPASNWVATNFTSQRRGFVMQNVRVNEKVKTRTAYYFE